MAEKKRPASESAPKRKVPAAKPPPKAAAPERASPPPRLKASPSARPSAPKPAAAAPETPPANVAPVATPEPRTSSAEEEVARRTPRPSSRKPEAPPPSEASAPAAPARARTREARSSGTSTSRGRPTATGAPRSAERKPQPLHIVIVASEAHPYAKTGGLAEVAGALPHALARLGHTVTLMVPRYGSTVITTPLHATHQTPHRPDDAAAGRATITLGRRRQDVTFIREAVADRVSAVLVDAPELFDREGLYGTAGGDYPDNAWRFAVFSRAALQYVQSRGERPSIIHAHDWQTGLVPVYQKMHLSGDPIVGGVPVVFTIHNLAFQGIFPPSTLEDIGLEWNVFDPNAMEYWGQVSYLKAGINFSEKITTVSPTYANEMLTPENGFGFEGILARRADDLLGILNGIDVERWNPAGDPFVEARYSVDTLSGKRRAKELLIEAAGLPRGQAIDRPVVGLISRLTDQKGFDLIAQAADELMTLDAAWVMLGSGEGRYEQQWRQLAAQHPARVAVKIGFDERLAHLIEAGADVFLMPSRFEPCGLNQLYSLRYGTVPVVRATGGLADTVEDFDPATGRGWGFTFRDYTPQALLGAIRRALDVFRDRQVWEELQRQGMRQDHSWDQSAREYVKVYRTLVEVTHNGIR